MVTRMAKQPKLLDKAIRNAHGLRFDEFETLLRQCGWTFDRQRGSHRIWYSPQGRRLSVQAKGKRAKGYQVEQFLKYYEEERSDEG